METLTDSDVDKESRLAGAVFEYDQIKDEEGLITRLELFWNENEQASVAQAGLATIGVSCCTLRRAFGAGWL